MNLSYTERILDDELIELPASKSISNRALIVQALCHEKIELLNLSEAEDTQILQSSLNNKSLHKHLGLAGTATRFISAFLALQKSNYLVDAASRMRERPMRELLEALETLGAEISYQDKAYHLPFTINGSKIQGGKLKISAKNSSQFASALLLIAPKLKGGLELELSEEINSAPYIKMSLEMLRYFGVKVEESGNFIRIEEQNYQGRSLEIESDWSAAAYFYSIVALLDEGSLLLKGLHKFSWQGDNQVSDIYYRLGVKTDIVGDCIRLSKSENRSSYLEYDFKDCPDLAQTVICSCVGLGIEGKFSGLHTLSLKESDRIKALQNELKQFAFRLREEDAIYFLERDHDIAISSKKIIKTYQDHRMAMSFAPLAIIYGEIEIENPEVVNKSFPSFWRELEKISLK
ncbi:MAG: 3-phosphoshikimate 1-carboxyvinyltransferase [Chitinophagales bacterium]|nr:3-phosphoshikimate 1-carboxyvinyltransferase [Chitinophagales bacterium]